MPSAPLHSGAVFLTGRASNYISSSLSAVYGWAFHCDLRRVHWRHSYVSGSSYAATMS